MVLVEKESEIKAGLLAVCEMCEAKIPDAKSCYVDTIKMKFLCVQCFTQVPTIEEAEELCRKIIKHQAFWAKRKNEFVAFSHMNAKQIDCPPVTPVGLKEPFNVESISLEEALAV
jgi:hypothetical protein